MKSGIVCVMASSMLVIAPSWAAPAVTPVQPIERQFDVRLTLAGVQHWQGGVQSTEASTRQDYDLSTRLRSNGVLYSDNLLDPDPDARLDIKQQYYARQGLLRLKAENGGKLPQTPADIERLGKRQGAPCADAFECHNRSIERFAAFSALKVNSVQQLDEFLASPGAADQPRYLFFFGYAGCPVRIHVTYDAHIAGHRAYNHARTDLVPYSLDRQADTPGSGVDQKTLCEQYVAVVDTTTGILLVENLFLPSPPGTSTRRINGNADTSTVDLPIPPVVLNWTSEKLRQAKASGSEKAVLDNTMPLDGDSTVQGNFTGKLDVSLSWSFKPVAATVPR